MLEAAAGAIQAETERAEGAAEAAARLPLLGLGAGLRALGTLSGWRLLSGVRRPHTTTAAVIISSLHVQEVAAGAKGTHAEGAVRAAGHVTPAAQGRALLRQAVDEQAAAAVVTVTSGVEAAAQLRLVLGVSERNVELVQPVSKLTALGVLAEPGGGVADAEFRLVAGGADPRDEGGWRRVHQGEQGFGEGHAFIRVLAGQQVVHQLLVLVRGQKQVVAGLEDKKGPLLDPLHTDVKPTHPTSQRYITITQVTNKNALGSPPVVKEEPGQLCQVGNVGIFYKRQIWGEIVVHLSDPRSVRPSIPGLPGVCRLVREDVFCVSHRGTCPSDNDVPTRVSTTSKRL